MRPAFDHHVEEFPATKVAPASGTQRPGDAHRNRTELIVLIVGLFALAWMVLMHDVRVGLSGLVMTSTRQSAGKSEIPSPREAPPVNAEGRGIDHPDPGPSLRSTGSDGP